MADISEQTKQDIMQFQSMQQQLQVISYQLQQLLVQEKELERAIDALKKSDKNEAFRFVGSIIVPKDRATLLKELEEEKEQATERKGLFEKQETKLKEKAQELRKKLEFLEKSL